jgi:hypothetical protein
MGDDTPDQYTREARRPDPQQNPEKPPGQADQEAALQSKGERRAKLSSPSELFFEKNFHITKKVTTL